MPLVIEMQVKLLFAYGVRNRLFGIGIVYFYVDMTSSIINWHKSGAFLGLLKRQISVIRWYQWRTSRDSNPEPTD